MCLEKTGADPLCVSLRETTNTPLFCSQRSSRKQTKSSVVENGADDYVTQNVQPAQNWLAAIKAVFCRAVSPKPAAANASHATQAIIIF